MRLVNAPVERTAEPGSAAWSAQEATRERSRLRRMILAMAVISLTLAAIFGRHGLLDVQRYRAERDRLRAEIATMEVEQARLEAEVAAIRKDPTALERVAREELSLARPGEAVILLVPENVEPRRH
jgi:cell division protein FtsB